MPELKSAPLLRLVRSRAIARRLHSKFYYWTRLHFPLERAVAVSYY